MVVGGRLFVEVGRARWIPAVESPWKREIIFIISLGTLSIALKREYRMKKIKERKYMH